MAPERETERYWIDTPQLNTNTAARILVHFALFNTRVHALVRTRARVYHYNGRMYNLLGSMDILPHCVTL